MGCCCCKVQGTVSYRGMFASDLVISWARSRSLPLLQQAKEEAAKAEKEGGKKAAAGGEAAPAAEGGAAADGSEKKGEDGKQ